MLLTGAWPFDDLEDEQAQKEVMDGHRPSFAVDVWNSTDPIVQSLKSAMFVCHEQDPKIRATAREVEAMLLRETRRRDPEALKRWGLVA